MWRGDAGQYELDVGDASATPYGLPPTDEEWEVEERTLTRMPKAELLDKAERALVLGAIAGALPGLGGALVGLSKLCASTGVTLGIGPSFAASGSVVPGVGVAGSFGIVLLPTFGQFGVYGSLSALGELTVTPIGGAVGGSITLLLTGVKGGLKAFKGQSVGLGVGGTVTSGLTGAVQLIFTPDFKRVIGAAGEIGGELGTETVTSGIKGFINFTHTEAMAVNELEFDSELGTGLQREFTVPKSLAEARARLRSQGMSERRVEKLLDKLGLDDAAGGRRGMAGRRERRRRDRELRYEQAPAGVAFDTGDDAVEGVLAGLDEETAGGLLEASDLEPADIILSTTAHPGSGLIRRLTGSTTTSHSVLSFGQGQVIEAVGGGVEIKPLAEALADDYHAMVYRHKNMTPARASVIVSFAVGQLGKGYDPVGALVHGLLKVPGGGDKRFYCSELVARAFEVGGVPLFTGPQRTPEEVRRVTSLEFVGYLKVPGTPAGEYELVDDVGGVGLDDDGDAPDDDGLEEELDIYDISYFEDLEPKPLQTAMTWAKILKNVFVPSNPLGFFSSLAKAGYLLLIDPFNRALKFGDQIAALHGVSYAIVARMRGETPPQPPPHFKRQKSRKAYIEGAAYVGRLVKDEPGEIDRHFPGLQGLEPSVAVNMVFGVLGLQLFGPQGGVAWRMIKDLTGSLRWRW